MPGIPSSPLLGQKTLVRGIANEYSIAFGGAAASRKVGAELAITYLNGKVRPHAEPLAGRERSRSPHERRTANLL